MSVRDNPSASVKGIALDPPAGGVIKPYHREMRLASRALDLLSVGLTLRVSVALAGWSWAERYTLLAAVACVVFYLSAEFFSVYYDRRSAPLIVDLRRLGAAWTATAFLVLFLGYVFQVSEYYSRVGVVSWLLLAPASLVASRIAVRAVLMRVRRLGYNVRRIAIVGAGEQGLRVASTVMASPWMGLKVVGIFDDRAPAPGRMAPELPCQLLGTTRDLLDVVRSGHIDIVYITLPINNNDRIIALMNALSDTTISLYFVPDMFLFSMFHGRWVRIGELPAVSVFETPFYGIEGWIKRLEDVLLSGLVLLATAVPMLLIALAITMTSPGPVIFRQRRYGLDGREFHIWKFRTMTVCEDDDTLEQATRADPRVTRLGWFLRRTSLDELPQFLNVLAGQMSVVGPRPHATGHNEHYRRLVKHYMVRHKVRPGITGWAQVHGLRGETETIDKMEKRVEYDLWYIRNWSVFLDLRIVFMTLRGAWRDDSAY